MPIAIDPTNEFTLYPPAVASASSPSSTSISVSEHERLLHQHNNNRQQQQHDSATATNHEATDLSPNRSQLNSKSQSSTLSPTARPDFDDEKQCKICLESDDFIGPDNDDKLKLISPCLCKGSSRWIHRGCLDTWRSQNKAGKGFTHCSVCNFQYEIETIHESPELERQRLIHYRLLVTRDFTLSFIVVISVVLLLAILIRLIDIHGTLLHTSIIGSLNHTSSSSTSSSSSTENGDDDASNESDSPLQLPLHPYLTYIGASCIFILFCSGVVGLVAYLSGWFHRQLEIDSHEGCCDTCLTACSSSNCTNCPTLCCVSTDCDCIGAMGGLGDSGPAGIGILVIIGIIFIIFGLIAGIALAIILARTIQKKHTKRLWLYELTQKHVVKDFNGKEAELAQVIQQRQNQQVAIDMPTTSTTNDPSQHNDHDYDVDESFHFPNSQRM